MIVWDPDAPGGPCGANLKDGTPDSYRIKRSASAGWTDINWTYGTLGESSKIGNDGACAAELLPGIKDMQPLQTLHVVEVFYNYSVLTPVGNFIGSILPATFYTRTVFTDVSGTA
jgi:hypothetical protein